MKKRLNYFVIIISVIANKKLDISHFFIKKGAINLAPTRVTAQ